MKRKNKTALVSLMLGLMIMTLGILTLKAKGFHTGLGGDWISLSREATWVLTVIIIFSGLYSLYYAIKIFLKKR